MVDTVDRIAVNTNSCVILDLDLKTVKKEDLAFSSPFEITATRNDFVHAFLAWFDIEFSACHKPIKFSTGPFSRYTHWKQTVFYTHKDLTVKVHFFSFIRFTNTTFYRPVNTLEVQLLANLQKETTANLILIFHTLSIHVSQIASLFQKTFLIECKLFIVIYHT